MTSDTLYDHLIDHCQGLEDCDISDEVISVDGFEIVCDIQARTICDFPGSHERPAEYSFRAEFKRIHVFDTSTEEGFDFEDVVIEI